ncbi:MAG: hydratase, partial [Clostridia bacterium]|nr:hydratase [Clostridia bacterium]
ETARRCAGAIPHAVLKELSGFVPADGTVLGSVVVSNKPGDGSAREQAASCQRVLGGIANICKEYATKRYRSNLINWGMIPFLIDKIDFKVGDYIYVEDIEGFIKRGDDRVVAKVFSKGKTRDVILSVNEFTENERAVLLSGCLINFNRKKRK